MSKTARFVVIINDNVFWMENQALQFYERLFEQKDAAVQTAEQRFSQKELFRIQNDFSIEILMVYEGENPQSFLKLDSSRLSNENLEAEKAICLKVFSSIVAVGDKVKLVTVNFPVVSVPVLSNTTCLILLRISKLLAFLNSTPLRAALPSPTAMAAGVARPMAQGHEITSTAMPLSKELLKGREAKK